MKNAAIIVAAGKGKRFKSKLPKQYLKINGMEVIAHAIKNFELISDIDAVLLVVEKRYIDTVKNKIVKKYGFKKVIDVVSGGKERYDSVYNAISYLKKYDPVNIFIHDGARPFFDSDLVRKIKNELKYYYACIPVKKITFTVKRIKGNFIEGTENRNFLRTAHTPQGFNFKKFIELYDEKIIKKIKPTDDAVLFEKKGLKVKIIEDEKMNIKITTREDFEILKKIVDNVKSSMKDK